MLGIFSCVLSSADFTSKSSSFEQNIHEVFRVSKKVDPDVGPNCYQQTTLVDIELRQVWFWKGELFQRNN